MKTLDIFLQSVEQLKNETYVDLNICNFKFSSKYTQTIIEFEIQCTHFALNHIRMLFGYLPEKEKATQSNDNRFKLKYSFYIKGYVYDYKRNQQVNKILIGLEELNKHARTNYKSCISLGGNSTDQKLYALHTIEKSRLINEKCTDNSIYDRSVNRARIIRKKIHNKELSESSRYLPFVKRALSNDTIFIF